MANENGGAARPRLQRYYEETVKPRLRQDQGLKNDMEIPRLEKITVNVGLGEAQKNPKLLESVVAELGQITGQKAVVTKAKKAISNFSLREGSAVGATVTLRRERMWEFLDRLINVAMPRVRDFRGVPTRSFDGRGNYTLGVKEQLIFPEIDYDKVEKVHGMDITIVTSTDRDDLALALLRELGMPFRGESPVQVQAA
jgi:large subunit ribosomal protein L5